MKGPFMDISKGNTLKLAYFDIHVLAKYFSNPQYHITYSDYRGSIAMKDEYSEYDDIEEYEYIKHFGLAYSKDNREKRFVVSFASDLAELSAKIQGYWYSYYIKDDNKLYPNEGFVKNLICGEWIDDISIYQALLMEIHYINIMCTNMNIPKLFNNEYTWNLSDIEDRPVNYHTVLLPTRDYYYNFINTLEKLIINSLNRDTFLTNGIFISKVEGKTEVGYTKGTLVLFDEWLKKNFKAIDIEENIIKPLKLLRKLRQKPAHELYKNVYDEKIWSDQKELIHEVYTAVRYIRLLFSNHPSNEDVEIPSYLYDGKHIVSY